MNDAVRFVLVILILDIVMIISLRQVLYDFLIGNCSKIGVRNIRENLSLQDRIRMEYIEQYIREDTEKKASGSIIGFTDSNVVRLLCCLRQFSFAQ